jgi:Trk-type K+ transport system membrane component
MVAVLSLLGTNVLTKSLRYESVARDGASCRRSLLMALRMACVIAYFVLAYMFVVIIKRSMDLFLKMSKQGLQTSSLNMLVFNIMVVNVIRVVFFGIFVVAFVAVCLFLHRIVTCKVLDIVKLPLKWLLDFKTSLVNFVTNDDHFMRARSQVGYERII